MNNDERRTYYRKYAHKRMFGGNREAAIVRDGGRCVRCGMTRDEHYEKHGRDITVDHIDGHGNGVPSASKNNALDNLQTLCIRCHASKDNSARKLSSTQVINIRHMRGSLSASEIAVLYGVSLSHTRSILNGTWRSADIVEADIRKIISQEQSK